MRDTLLAAGRFTFECWADGVLLWSEITDNIVATVGKNLAFNTFLSGSGYTVTGPYMGLISGTGFTGVAASDIMASHPGWLEAGGLNEPTYTAPRPTCIWAPAANGAIAIGGTVGFAMTGSGTVQGAFIVYGPGAVSVIDDPHGTLWSAAAFQGGPQVVAHGAELRVGYSVSM